MGLMNGSASYVRFAVTGDLPENALDFIARRISAYSFRDIDESTDEYSVGWVSVLNMFDAAFEYASFRNGDYIVLSLRIDERKVSPAVIKKYIAKEEERVRRQRNVPKIGRAAKIEIKERVRAELTAKAIPVPTIYDLCWNLSDTTLLFFTTNKKAHTVLEDFFKDCFGLLLVQQIPYNTAEKLVSSEQVSALEAMSPQLFI
jgi:DNA recombination-dependent growth factor C